MAPNPLGTQPPSDETDPSAAGRAGLSIGELAQQTGVRPATLRGWESRFGFPSPMRLDSGHRRYPASAVEDVRTVLRHQRRGLQLGAAIADLGTAPPDAADTSVFRVLSQRPGVAAHRLSKRTLVALSHAIEDEICTSTSSPILFGAFQTVARYGPSRPRWRELARTAASTVVFADFEDHDTGGVREHEPMRVSLPAAARMHREWAVVCDDPSLSVCLSGWELPGQADVPDASRIYEAAWTLEPSLVRRAARACVGFTGVSDAPSAEALTSELDAAPCAPKADAEHASRLFERFVTYLDRAGRAAS